MFYYTYDKETKSLRRAPINVIEIPPNIKIANPKAKDYELIGAYPLKNITPEPIEGKIAVIDDYLLINNFWVPQYRYEDEPVRIRRFSKLKIVSILINQNLWASVKQWMDQNGLYDLYLAAQEFSEDNEWFLQGKQQLMEQLQLTEEQVEDILSQCEIQ